MSDLDDKMASEPPVIDPYEVLGLERTATQDQVKKAYHKAALKNHPDKVPEAHKAAAHVAFQRIALAHAVLSDAARRARYDATGSTADSLHGAAAGGFDWRAYYRAAFADAVAPAALAAFAAAYRGSAEERRDVLAAYAAHRGAMDALYERVLLSSAVADDARFRAVIDAAIARGEVRAFARYTRESAARRAARVGAARAEAREAEAYARELGVHEALFGPAGGQGAGAAVAPAAAAAAAAKGGVVVGTGKARGGTGKENGGEDALAALIVGRQKERANAFIDQLAEKYGAGASSKKGKKGKQQAFEDGDEPDEEAFQAAAARLGGGKKKASEDAAPKASKRSKR